MVALDRSKIPPLMQIVPVGPQKGKLRFNFHSGQLKAWESNRRFVCVLAGTQSGKTSFGSIWLWREIKRCGPGDFLVVTPTYPLLGLKALPEFLKLFQDDAEVGEVRWQSDTSIYVLARWFKTDVRIRDGSGNERLLRTRQRPGQSGIGNG